MVKIWGYKFVPGGTGPCWNIYDKTYGGPEEPPTSIHICDLDEFIQALQELKNTKEYDDQVNRWK